MPNNVIYSIAIDGSGNKWIGTNGGGLAIYKAGGVVSVHEITGKNFPEVFALFQNYPNPFNPSTNISFYISSKIFVSLKIFDLIGREVATILSEEMSAGIYARQWNAASMPSGVYFYRLTARHTSGGQAGSFMETKKLVVLR